MIHQEIVEPKSTVVSMVHIDIVESKPGLIPSSYLIKKGTMEKPSVTEIGPAIHYVYLDGDRGSLPVRDASYEVARSIVEDYSAAQLCITDDAFPGIFWLPGKWALEDIEREHALLLFKMRDAHQRWMLKLTQSADDDFSRYEKHNVVSDFQRKVAEILKLKPEQHPWMNVVNTLESHSCPGCGTLYRPGIAFCPNCRTIVDKEKFASLEIAR